MLSILSRLLLALFEATFADAMSPDFSARADSLSFAAQQCSSSTGSLVVSFLSPLRIFLALLVMFFVSPLVRNHVCDICYDATASALSLYRSVCAEMSRDHKITRILSLENVKLRADLDEMKSLRVAEQNRIAQLEKELEHQRTVLKTLQDEEELYKTNVIQTMEIEDLTEEVERLKTKIDSRDRRHHAEVTDWKSTNNKLEKAYDAMQKALSDSRQAQNISRGEADRLRSQLSTQAAHQQEAITRLERDHAHEIYPYKCAMKALLELSESTGDHLTAATIVADALKRNGISLDRLGIDERRARVLCEFVGRGQSPYDAVQPQAFVRGFSFNPPPSPAHVQPQQYQPEPQRERNYSSFGALLEQQQQLQQQVLAPAFIEPPPTPDPFPFQDPDAIEQQQSALHAAGGEDGVSVVGAPLAPAATPSTPWSSKLLDDHYTSKRKRRQRW